MPWTEPDLYNTLILSVPAMRYGLLSPRSLPSFGISRKTGYK